MIKSLSPVSTTSIVQDPSLPSSNYSAETLNESGYESWAAHTGKQLSNGLAPNTDDLTDEFPVIPETAEWQLTVPHSDIDALVMQLFQDDIIGNQKNILPSSARSALTEGISAVEQPEYVSLTGDHSKPVSLVL